VFHFYSDALPCAKRGGSLTEHHLPSSRISPTTSWLCDVFLKTSAATGSTSGQRPKEEGRIFPLAGFTSVAVLQAAHKHSFALCQSQTNWGCQCNHAIATTRQEHKEAIASLYFFEYWLRC